MTEDVNIWINPAPDNVTRLIAALADYGQGFGETLAPADFSDEPAAWAMGDAKG